MPAIQFLDENNHSVPVGWHKRLPTGTPAEWSDTDAVGISGTATATKAGEAGKRHTITAVSVSFGPVTGTSSVTIQIKSGSTVLWQVRLVGAINTSPVWEPDLGEGLLCAAGEAASVVATTSDGNLDCNIAGYTR